MDLTENRLLTGNSTKNQVNVLTLHSSGLHGKKNGFQRFLMTCNDLCNGYDNTRYSKAFGGFHQLSSARFATQSGFSKAFVIEMPAVRTPIDR